MGKASELIEDLKTLIEERGDLEVVNEDNEGVMVEYNNDDEEEVFVIA